MTDFHWIFHLDSSHYGYIFLFSRQKAAQIETKYTKWKNSSSLWPFKPGWISTVDWELKMLSTDCKVGASYKFKMIRLLRNARVPSIVPSFGHDTIRRSPGLDGGFSRGMAHGIQWLNSFVNYEQIGVPKNAGGDSDLGFPMVCIVVCEGLPLTRRVLEPQTIESRLLNI
jgi:hypothetical protein